MSVWAWVYGSGGTSAISSMRVFDEGRGEGGRMIRVANEDKVGCACVVNEGKRPNDEE